MTEKSKDKLRYSYLSDEKNLKAEFVFSRFPHLEDINDSWCLAEFDNDLIIRHATWSRLSGSEVIDINDISITKEEFITLLEGFSKMVLLDDNDNFKGIYDGPHYELVFLDVNLNENRYKTWIGCKTFEYLKTCFPERLFTTLGFSRSGQIM